MDTVSGTSGNDTINALVDYTAGGVATSASTTFSATDTITGGAGTDVLNLTVTGSPNAGVTLAAATVTGVETINIRSVPDTVQIVTVAGANFSGATAFNSDRSTQAVTITGLAAGASAGQVGNASVTNGALTFGYATASSAATLNVSGGTKGTGAVTISSDPTTVTINSTGAANTIGTVDLSASAVVTSATINAATNLTLTSLSNDFTAATTDKLTVSGAATLVTLGALPATVDIVDASGLTAGGVSMTIGAVGQVITGGLGNDTITTAGVQTGAVNAGAGTGDRLIAANAADIAATPAAKFTNFEILRLSAAAATQDVSNVAGITSIELNANGVGATKMTATQAAAVTNLIDNATQTLALATATGTADALTVTLKNATSTASADLTGATVTGFETVNVVSSSGSSADINSLTFAAAGDTSALNLSGAFPISVATGNLTKAVAINASGVTYVGSTATDYSLTISGNLVKSSSVIGSGAADSITTTAAITGTTGDYVTYDAGAGNDAISSTVAAIYNNGAATGSVKIDGGAGTDTLTITGGGATMVDANFQYLTNIEKVTVGAAGAVAITSGGFFDTNFKTGGITLTAASVADNQTASIALSTFTGNATIALTTAGVGDTVNDNVDVSTGSGNDTITVTAASWVGHATTNGHIVISGGAGTDTIALTTGTLLANANAGELTQIKGGQGADAITVTHVNAGAGTTGFVTFTVNAGDSTKAAYDTITGFKMSDIGGADAKLSDGLDFGTSAISAAVAATAVTGYSAAELTYAINGTTGLVTFAGTAAAGLTVTQVLDILDVVVATGKTAFWASTTDTYVYNADSTNGDSVVKLAGVVAEALITTNDVTTNNGVFIN